MKQLTSLGFGGLKLTSLPIQLFTLKNLTYLDLSRNQLTSLPPEIVQLSNLKELWLDDNPLVSPPPEIVRRGIEAIREYFTTAQEGTSSVAEVKEEGVLRIGKGLNRYFDVELKAFGVKFDYKTFFDDILNKGAK